MRPHRFTLLLVAALSGCSTSAADMSFGSFEGQVRTEWLRGSENERRMSLLEDFTYLDPKGKRWTAPMGAKTDGATIPQVVWSVVGGPFEGQYREAAVIHDQYCDTKSEPWRDVHRIFYYVNRAAGVSEYKSKVLYGAVMIGGPKWGKDNSKCFEGCHNETSTKIVKDAKGRLTAHPPISTKDVQQLAEWIAETKPSLEQIDERIRKSYPNSKFGHEAN